MSTKQEIRHKMKSTIAAIEEEKLHKSEDCIYKRLFSQEAWVKAQCVAVTISGTIEIDTLPIIRQGWQEGKRIVVPKCLPENKLLDFRQLENFNQLETVYYGLKEPIISKTESVERNWIDLVIVPGLVFDTKGYRIGFGGGYYDRFLEGFKGITVALALDQQVLPSLPIETYDLPVNWIITPTQVIQC